jgi:hypothetical protein
LPRDARKVEGWSGMLQSGSYCSSLLSFSRWSSHGMIHMQPSDPAAVIAESHARASATPASLSHGTVGRVGAKCSIGRIVSGLFQVRDSLKSPGGGA